MKLTEIAKAIMVHLCRLEADKEFNWPRAYDKEKQAWVPKPHGLTPIYMPNVYRSGSFVVVKYVSYESGDTRLSKADAEEYLKWLEAGNKGTDLDMDKATGSLWFHSMGGVDGN